MDNHIFRTAIHGFHRQDVIEYIERTQKQAEESTSWLESQVDQLQRSENEAQMALRECQQERDELAAKLEKMTAQYNNACSNWESQAKAKESSRRDVAQRDQTIRDMTEENQQLFYRVQELEGCMEDLRRQKEQLAQMELDARKRGDMVVSEAEARAKAILEEAEKTAQTVTEKAEAEAQAVTAHAKAYAERITKEAEKNRESVIKETKMCIVDTTEDFNEVMQSFQKVSSRIAGELKNMEQSLAEFPLGLNELKKDLDALYGQVSKKEADIKDPPPKKPEAVQDAT